jgi:glycosyltransferase involved in cell wall biosynthesis
VIDSSQRAPPLSVLVPTCNERVRLQELGAALFGTNYRAGLDAELIVVDDNSPDGTGRLADQLAKSIRGESKRNGKEAIGYVVQLRDRHRFRHRQPSPQQTYRRISVGELEAAR